MTHHGEEHRTIYRTVAAARRSGRELLLESEALEVVEGLGLGRPRTAVLAGSSDVLDLPLHAFPCHRLMVKAMIPGVLHKTELGAVHVVPRDRGSVRDVIREMEGRIRPAPVGFLVQAFVPHGGEAGSELLLSVRWTAEFGAVVTLGLGGTGVERLGGALPPGDGWAVVAADRTDVGIERALRGRTLTALATGSGRGRDCAVPLPRLVALVRGAAAFARSHLPHPFLEVEVNPVVFTDGGPVALDAVARLAPLDAGDHTDAARGAPPRPLGRISRLLRPRSAAVMGVSASMNPGRVILRNMLDAGFPADSLMVVKPGCDMLDGCRCVPDLSALDAPVDLLVLAVAADQVPDLLEQVVRERRAESVVLIPGGLGERPGTGERAERVRRTLEEARSHPQWSGPVVNGGNCLGIRSVPGRVNTLFIPPEKLGLPEGPPSPLAVISQSGALAVAGLGRLPLLEPRYLVTVGNQLDLTLADWLEHLAEDAAVRVFAAYVEGFRLLDGARFLRVAEALAAEGRPVILYRGGRSAEGARATASHTASLAGDWGVTRDLATQAGALVAETLEDFHDLVRLAVALHDRPVEGPGLGAMSNAGFETVAMADALGTLRLPELSGDTVARIGALLGERGLESLVTVRNPLDVTPMLDDEGFAAVAASLLADDAVALGIIGCVPHTPALATARDREGTVDPGAPGSVGPRLVSLWRNTAKPWVAVVDAGAHYAPLVRVLGAGGVPTFRTADRALRLLERWAAWRLERTPDALSEPGPSPILAQAD